MLYKSERIHPRLFEVVNGKLEKIEFYKKWVKKGEWKGTLGKCTD